MNTNHHHHKQAHSRLIFLMARELLLYTIFSAFNQSQVLFWARLTNNLKTALKEVVIFVSLESTLLYMSHVMHTCHMIYQSFYFCFRIYTIYETSLYIRPKNSPKLLLCHSMKPLVIILPMMIFWPICWAKYSIQINVQPMRMAEPCGYVCDDGSAFKQQNNHRYLYHSYNHSHWQLEMAEN